MQTGNGLPAGVRLAVQAMQYGETTPTTEAYQTLRNALALLPRVIARMAHDGGVRFASLSADGRVLATADIRTIRVWDARQGRLIASRAYGRGVFFTGLTLSPDARLLAVGNGGFLEVLRVPAVDAARDTPDALADAVFRPALRQPQRPTFSPDGCFFAAPRHRGRPHARVDGGRLDRTGDPTPWACRFALNKARQWIERRQRWQALLDHGLAEELAERRQELQPEFERRLRHLDDCLGKLPPAQHSLVQAYYYQRTDIESLARSSGRTVAATYKMLQRIRQALQLCVEAQTKPEVT